MTPLNFSFATCMTCDGIYFVTMFNQSGCGMMQINHRLVNMITPEYLRLSGKEGMRSVENEECGKYRVWKIRSVENAECGKCRMWKMRSVENAECVVTLTTLRIFHTPHFPHLFSTLHIFHTPHFPHSPFHTQHFPDLTFARFIVFLFSVYTFQFTSCVCILVNFVFTVIYGYFLKSFIRCFLLMDSTKGGGLFHWEVQVER